MYAGKQVPHWLISSVNSMRIASRNTASTSTSNSAVTVRKDHASGIATMYLNNPPVNQLDGEMLQRCTETIKSLEADSDVHGIIFTSSFDGKVFSAGLNIFDMYKKSHKHVVKYWTQVQNWHLATYGCRKATVACINGHSPAGGCAFALMADYRVMQGGAKKFIGLNEVMLGIATTFSIADLLIKTIGRRSAEIALLKGRLFSAEEALEAGVVNAVGKLEDINDMATNALKEAIKVNVDAYGMTKLIMRQSHLDNLRKVQKEEAEEFAERILLPDTQKHIGDYLSRLKK